MAIQKISTTNFIPTKLPIRASAEKVNEIIDAVNAITGVTGTTVLDATNYAITLDAATTPHTGLGCISINANVNVSNGSNRYAAITNALAISTALGAGEEAEGKYLTIAGLTADADTSALNGIKMSLGEVTGGRADVTGIYCTISSVRDNADTDTGFFVTFTGTQSHASAVTAGVSVTSASMTHTTGTFYGLLLTGTNTITAGTYYGAYLNVSSTSMNNPRYGLYIAKDLTNAAASGALSTTNSALYVSQTSASSTANSGASTVSNTMTYFGKTNSAATARADVWGGKIMQIAYTATVTGTGTATNSERALDVIYNIVNTAGTLTCSAFNVAQIDLEVSATIPTFSAGSFNVLYLKGATGSSPTYGATCYVSGLSIDMSGMTMSSANLLVYGIKLALPSQSTSHCADIALSGTVNVYSGVAVTRAAVRALVGDAAPQGSMFIAQASVATTKPNLYVKVLNTAANTDWERVVTAATD